MKVIYNPKTNELGLMVTKLTSFKTFLRERLTIIVASEWIVIGYL